MNLQVGTDTVKYFFSFILFKPSVVNLSACKTGQRVSDLKRNYVQVTCIVMFSLKKFYITLKYCKTLLSSYKKTVTQRRVRPITLRTWQTHFTAHVINLSICSAKSLLRQHSPQQYKLDCSIETVVI